MLALIVKSQHAPPRPARFCMIVATRNILAIANNPFDDGAKLERTGALRPVSRRHGKNPNRAMGFTASSPPPLCARRIAQRPTQTRRCACLRCRNAEARPVVLTNPFLLIFGVTVTPSWQKRIEMPGSVLLNPFFLSYPKNVPRSFSTNPLNLAGFSR